MYPEIGISEVIRAGSAAVPNYTRGAANPETAPQPIEATIIASAEKHALDLQRITLPWRTIIPWHPSQPMQAEPNLRTQKPKTGGLQPRIHEKTPLTPLLPRIFGLTYS